MDFVIFLSFLCVDVQNVVWLVSLMSSRIFLRLLRLTLCFFLPKYVYYIWFSFGIDLNFCLAACGCNSRFSPPERPWVDEDGGAGL